MWNLTVTNISGIRSGSTTIEDGLNVVQASNFRGKSSLIAALQTAIGATGHYDQHPLTEGVDEGGVTLGTETGEYSVTLERAAPHVARRTGDPYLTDETDQVSARLFACLDENNPIREAVRNGEDLTELLQAPLNIEDIDAQIANLKTEKREIEKEIAAAERAGEKLPAVQETVTGLESELEELRNRRQELESTETNKQRIEELSDEISTKSGEVADLSDDISRLESQIERKRDKVTQKEEELADLETPEERETTTDVEAVREELETLSQQIDIVEDLYRANKNVLDEGDVDVISDVDRSIASDQIECWVCGSRTTKKEIEEFISELHSRISTLRDQRSEREAKLEEVKKHQQEIQEIQEQRERLKRKIRQLKAKIDENKGILQTKRERKEELETEITALREDLEDLEDEYNEALTDLKTEVRTTESELRDERKRLDSLEQQYAKLETLKRDRDDIQSQLTEIRNRKKNTQENLKERFNTIINEIITEFEPGFSSARLVLKTDDRGEVEQIDLEIARDIDNKGQQTSVDALSEGETELIGLVVPLAGYHAFDVGSKVPCILIDGISQLAAEHLRTAATYLDDMNEVLVTTAYPEAGEFDGHIIEPDEWEVISDKHVATT